MEKKKLKISEIQKTEKQKAWKKIQLLPVVQERKRRKHGHTIVWSCIETVRDWTTKLYPKSWKEKIEIFIKISKCQNLTFSQVLWKSRNFRCKVTIQQAIKTTSYVYYLSFINDFFDFGQLKKKHVKIKFTSLQLIKKVYISPFGPILAAILISTSGIQDHVTCVLASAHKIMLLFSIVLYEIACVLDRIVEPAWATWTMRA